MTLQSKRSDNISRIPPTGGILAFRVELTVIALLIGLCDVGDCGASEPAPVSGYEDGDRVIEGTIRLSQFHRFAHVQRIELILAEDPQADGAEPLAIKIIDRAARRLIPFAIDVPKASVRDDTTYALKITIRDPHEGTVIVSGRYAVLTQGNPDTLHIALQPVGEQLPER